MEAHTPTADDEDDNETVDHSQSELTELSDHVIEESLQRSGVLEWTLTELQISNSKDEVYNFEWN